MEKITVLLPLVFSFLLCCTKPVQETASARTFPIRFSAIADSAESGVNMLFVTSPWNPDEFMALDFPEHCWGSNFSGVSTDTRSGPKPTRWRFNSDSTRAMYEVEAADGNLFRAEAVSDSMAVRMSIEITNNTGQPIKDIRILVCTRAHEMASFVDTNYALTYVAVENQPVRFGVETTFHGELPPRMPPAWVMNIKGGIDNRTVSDMGWFSADWGRRMFRMVEEKASPALIAVQSRQNRNRWIATIWNPSRVLFSNPHIPCIHSDPVPPDCPPGETTRADGVVFFHHGTWEELIERAIAWRDG